MAEKIKIADLTINAKGIVKELQATKKAIDELNDQQKQLKKTGDTSSKTFVENEAKLKSLRSEYTAQKKTYESVTGASKTLRDELNKENKSRQGAIESNKQLRKAKKFLNTETEEGAKTLNEVNRKIDENTKYIEKNSDSTEKRVGNIGNYKQSIREALGIEQLQNQAMQVMIPLQSAYNTVVGKSSGALKVFKIALASTGIGLLVIALGSLITYLTTTQAGIDKVNRVLTPMKELFGTLIGQVQELGGAFFKLLSGDFDGFVDDIKKVADTIGEDLSNAISRGSEMARIQENLNKSEAKYITQQAKLRKEFEEQKKLSDDTTKSSAEREKAAQRAIELQEEISKGTIERINQEAELLKLKQMANDTSDAEKAELARKLAEIDKALEEEAAKTTEAQNKLNAIRQEAAKKAAEARQKALDDAVTKQKEELDFFIASQGIRAKTLQEQVNIAKDVAKQKLEILDAQLEAGQLSEQAYATEKLKINQELLEKQTNLAVDNADRELQAFKDANQSKLTANQELTDALVNQEQQRLDRIAEKEREYQARRLEEGVINEIQYNDAINAINEENRLNKEAKQAELDAQKEEKRLARIEFEKQQQIALAETEYERQLAQLEQKYQADIAYAKKIGADTASIEQAYADQKEDIERAKFQSKINMAQDTLGAVLGVMDKESAAGKAVATAMSLINTYQGITQALASAPPPLNFIQAAAVGAAGFKAVADINSTKKPNTPSAGERTRLAKGGVLSGPSHANGGIDIGLGYEAEGGEAVINKRSTAMFAPLLSAINTAGGGRKLAKGGIIDNTGIKNSLNVIDYEKLAASIAQANLSLPAPLVAVSEINDTNARVKSIEQKASF